MDGGGGGGATRGRFKGGRAGGERVAHKRRKRVWRGQREEWCRDGRNPEETLAFIMARLNLDLIL